MRVHTIEIDDFRGIEHLVIEVPEAQTTVFVGANGAGKSTILDAVAILLSRLAGRIRSLSANGRMLAPGDIRVGAPFARIAQSVSVFEENLSWALTKHRRGHARGQKISNLASLKEVVERVQASVEAPEEWNLPLMVHYPVHRAVLDIPLRIRKRHTFDQLSAYDNALSGSSGNFRVFFEWFRGREDLENEHRRDAPGSRDRQLEAVRKAISILMGDDYGNLRVRRNPLRMTVEKAGEPLRVDYLSDGEKGLLALAGDLGRRLAIANPSLPDPLLGTGIALIDEVDLHLHPSWQRKLVPALERAFPEVQFLLTTHSPSVLGHVQDRSVVVLERDRGGPATATTLSTYGKDANRILEDVLGSSARPQDIKDELTSIHDAISGGRLDEATRSIETLRAQLVDDPALVHAEALVRRKRNLGR